MRLSKKIYAAFLVFLLIAGVSIATFNIFYVPRGIHLAYVISKPDAHPQAFQWLSLLMYKPVSRLAFKYTGRYCDAPYYEHGKLVPGENWTVGMLVAATADVTQDQGREAYEYLNEALSRCDPNAISPGQPLSPLHAAIMFRRAEVVLALLKANANTFAKIDRPGKSIDGMNALEFSHYLEKVVNDEESRQAYSNIAQLIVQHNAGISTNDAH